MAVVSERRSSTAKELIRVAAGVVTTLLIAIAWLYTLSFPSYKSSFLDTLLTFIGGTLVVAGLGWFLTWLVAYAESGRNASRSMRVFYITCLSVATLLGLYLRLSN